MTRFLPAPRIRTQISESGGRVEAGTVVPTRDRRTRQERYEALDDDLDYTAGQLDRAVTSRSQIRTVLETFRDRLFTEIFPGRTSVPKTLIFCKDDNHAEEVTQTVREVFGKGNDFAAKITYSAKEPDKLLAAFRNSATLRVATTVDMIATGTDVKPLECVMFLRDVRSAAYFEQMKGRGARTIPDADLQSVTPGALRKDRFVLVDAIGVTEHEYIDAAPLNRKKSESLDKLLGKVAALTATEDDVSTLASRLARLEKDLTDAERNELAALAGADLTVITRGLVEALDPDRQAAAIEAAGPGADPDAVREALIEAAITPLASNPELRTRLVDLRKQHDIVIDETSQDKLLEAAGIPAAERAQATVVSWRDFIEKHKDEIAALQVLYSRPAERVTYADLRALANRIEAPPYRWTPDLLWQAYSDLDASRVRRSDRHAVTDLIRLVRYELQRDGELVPYRDIVEERYQGWILRQEQAGATFTDEQRWWLDAIRDTVVQAAGVHLDDLDEAPFTNRNGLDGAYEQFGAGIRDIVIELDRELGA